MDAGWNDDGTGAHVEDDTGLRGFLQLVSDWYEPESRRPRIAWVVDWMGTGHDAMQRSLVELGGAPTQSRDVRERLASKAAEVIEHGPESQPPPFAVGSAGLTTPQQLRDLIEHASHAVQHAIADVFHAARREDEHATVALNAALVPAVGHIRALDELMQHVWTQALTEDDRRRTSAAVDERVKRPRVSADARAEAKLDRQPGFPCPYWTQALLAKGVFLPREELRAFRWLAGKVLHHGPLSVVALQQWRQGAEPRWKWRPADEVFPPSLLEERPGQRRAYDTQLAGRDVLGKPQFTTALIEAEHLFFRLLRDSA